MKAGMNPGMIPTWLAGKPIMNGSMGPWNGKIFYILNDFHLEYLLEKNINLHSGDIRSITENIREKLNISNQNLEHSPSRKPIN